MRNIFKLKLLIIIGAFLMSILHCLGKNGLECSLSVARSEYAIGEPIPVHLMITNKSDYIYMVSLPEDGVQDFIVIFSENPVIKKRVIREGMTTVTAIGSGENVNKLYFVQMPETSGSTNASILHIETELSYYVKGEALKSVTLETDVECRFRKRSESEWIILTESVANKLLSHQRTERHEAAMYLEALRNEVVLPYLYRGVSSPDSLVSMLCARGLDRFPRHKKMDLVWKALENADVQAQVKAYLLKSVGDDEDVDQRHLRKVCHRLLLHAADPVLVKECITVLKRIGIDKSREILSSLRKSSNPVIRAYAKDALLHDEVSLGQRLDEEIRKDSKRGKIGSRQ